MRATKKHFLALLSMELEDMREDIDALIRNCENRKDRGEITEYVFQENITVYQSLLSGVECMDHAIKQVDLDADGDLNDLTEHLCQQCHARLLEHGLSRGLERALRRKVGKIARFLEGTAARKDAG